MTHVLLIHVGGPESMYQLGCDSDLVLVTKKPVRGFWGLGDSQEPHSDSYKTGGNKEKFYCKPGLWDIYSNI